MHMPKTGGTSIDSYFSAKFPDSSITHCEHMFRQKQYSEISSYHYASGHVTYSALLRSNVVFEKLIISYRDPIAQLCSHIRWLALIGQDTDSVMFQSQGKAIQRIARKICDTDFTDAQAVSEYVSSLAGRERGLFDNLLTRYFCPFKIGGARVGNAHLIAAVSTLRDIDYLIETENMHSDITEIFSIENISAPDAPTHENSGRAKLTNDILMSNSDQLKPLYKFDQRLVEAINRRSKFGKPEEKMAG
jgi:hypothetical protein